MVWEGDRGGWGPEVVTTVEVDSGGYSGDSHPLLPKRMYDVFGQADNTSTVGEGDELLSNSLSR